MRRLEHLVRCNYDNDGTESGYPWPLGNPGWYSGQDVFLASLETKDIQNETYFQALEFCKTSTQKGINDALNFEGQQLSGLLVPPKVGQTYPIMAQAGFPT